MNQKSLHILVSGRVQGVFFRKHTEAMALEMGVVGWVRNLSDGRVEVLVTLAQDQVEEFKSRVQQGSPVSQVDRIEVEEVHLQSEFKEFQITRDGDGPWLKQ